MPKITGPSIAEHVAVQEAAVFAAATRLFAERGVDNVSMGTIADQVGLARSSLYRYFPTKSAIVHRWFETVMTPLIADSDEIARSDLPRTEQFMGWVDRQIDFLSNPTHREMIRAVIEAEELGEAQRASMSERHGDLYASLATIITDPAIDDVTTRARVRLIVDLLRTHADLAAAGIPDSVIRAELIRTAVFIAAIG